MNKPTRWIIGILLAGLLLGAYVGMWRPARAWLTQEAVFPLLAHLAAKHPERYAVAPGADPLMLTIRSARTGGVASGYRAPGGILFIAPALLLIALFPFKPYWLYYGGLHIGLGLMSLIAVALGIGWSSWGFTAHDFINSYVVPAVSLALPLLALFPLRPPKATSAQVVAGVEKGEREVPCCGRPLRPIDSHHSTYSGGHTR